MFTAGLFYPVLHFIDMQEGLGARRHLSITAVIHFVRRTLRKYLSKTEMSVFPRGHREKQTKKDADMMLAERNPLLFCLC